jgi:hypothetical protein
LTNGAIQIQGISAARVAPYCCWTIEASPVPSRILRRLAVATLTAPEKQVPRRSGVLAAGCLVCWASAALAQNGDDFQRQPAVARTARYAVEGLALGSHIAFDSSAYCEYKCAPSDQFDGFFWCQKISRNGTRRRSFETKYSMLHSRDGTIVYVNRYQRPALVGPDEAESEIQNYSRRLGESPRLTN